MDPAVAILHAGMLVTPRTDNGFSDSRKEERCVMIGSVESPVPPLPNQDLEHLKLLSVFHYIVGGIGFLFACFPIIHLIVGIAILVMPPKSHDEAAPAFVGILFICLAVFFILLGWSVATCAIISGRKIAQQKSWLFSVVVAGILCAFMPFGTILGVFTIVVLCKDSVKALYRSKQPALT